MLQHSAETKNLYTRDHNPKSNHMHKTTSKSASTFDDSTEFLCMFGDIFENTLFINFIIFSSPKKLHVYSIY